MDDMAPSGSSDDSGRALEELAKLLKSNDFDQLRTAFVEGKVTADELINEIAARYQRSIGSAVQAIAEHDKIVARRVGERLRDRLDELLRTLASRDAVTQQRKKAPKTSGVDDLKDRAGEILQREYLILAAISKSDLEVRAADLLALVQKFDGSLSDNVVTAHLSRMYDMGVIGKAGKGRYHKVAAGATHLAYLVDAIEARGLALPPLSG